MVISCMCFHYFNFIRYYAIYFLSWVEKKIWVYRKKMVWGNKSQVCICEGQGKQRSESNAFIPLLGWARARPCWLQSISKELFASLQWQSQMTEPQPWGQWEASFMLSQELEAMPSRGFRMWEGSRKLWPGMFRRDQKQETFMWNDPVWTPLWDALFKLGSVDPGSPLCLSLQPVDDATLAAIIIKNNFQESKGSFHGQRLKTCTL